MNHDLAPPLSTKPSPVVHEPHVRTLAILLTLGNNVTRKPTLKLAVDLDHLEPPDLGDDPATRARRLGEDELAVIVKPGAPSTLASEEHVEVHYVGVRHELVFRVHRAKDPVAELADLGLAPFKEDEWLSCCCLRETGSNTESTVSVARAR